MPTQVFEIHPDNNLTPVTDPGAWCYQTINDAAIDLFVAGLADTHHVIFFGGCGTNDDLEIDGGSWGGLTGITNWIFEAHSSAVHGTSMPLAVRNAGVVAWLGHDFDLNLPGSVIVRGLAFHLAQLKIFTTDTYPTSNVLVERVMSSASHQMVFDCKPTGGTSHSMTAMVKASAWTDGPLNFTTSAGGSGSATINATVRNWSNVGEDGSINFMAYKTGAGASTINASVKNAVICGFSLAENLFIHADAGASVTAPVTDSVFTDETALATYGGVGCALGDTLIGGGEIVVNTTPGDVDYALQSNNIARAIGGSSDADLPTYDLAGNAWGGKYNAGAVIGPPVIRKSRWHQHMRQAS